MARADDNSNDPPAPRSWFDWVVEGRVVAMHRPSSRELAELAASGIDHVISLSGSPLDEELLLRHGMASTHLPLADMSAPTIEQMDLFVRTLRDLLDAGHKVVVHCGAGYGRTGTMMAAWFVSQGLSAEDALKEIRLRRPGSVESRLQEQAVREYEEHVRE